MAQTDDASADSGAARFAGAAAATLWALLVLALTLTPGSEPVANGPLWCIRCIPIGSRFTSDLILNVGFFVPFGFALRFAGIRLAGIAALSFALTLLVETVQLELVAGRFASLTDIIANVTGGVVGAGVAARWPVISSPGPHLARCLAAAALVVCVAVFFVTGYLLAPSVPHGEYLLHGESRSGEHPVSAGAFIGGVPVAGGAAAGDLRDRLLRGKAVLELIVPTPAAAPQRVRVDGPDGVPVLLLARRGRNVEFRVHRNAADARVRYPELRVRMPKDALADTGLIRIRAEAVRSAMRLSVVRPAAAVVTEFPITPGLGWSFFTSSYRVPPAVRPWVTALWIAILAAPIGYWSAHGWWPDARRQVLAGLVAGMGLVVALAVSSQVFRIGFPAWFEWTAAAGGLAAASYAGRRRCSAITRGR